MTLKKVRKLPKEQGFVSLPKELDIYLLHDKVLIPANQLNKFIVMLQWIKQTSEEANLAIHYSATVSEEKQD